MTQSETVDPLETLIAEKAAEGNDSGWAVALILLKSLKVQTDMRDAFEQAFFQRPQA